jgi:(2Fe-2S) ferredoxin
MAVLARHIFVCTNRRPEPRPSCGVRGDAAHIAVHLAERLRQHRGPSDGGITVVQTRCLGHCEQGPVVAIVPDDVWYTYRDEDDIDEIVSEHIVGGRPVRRLLLQAQPAAAASDRPQRGAAR